MTENQQEYGAFTDLVRGFAPTYDCTDRELILRAVRVAGAGGPRCTRRAAVGAIFGHGSGFSHAICQAAGVDPDEMVGHEQESDE